MEISLMRQIASFAGAILAYIAFHPFQLGFVVLETAWAILSIWALLRPQAQPE